MFKIQLAQYINDNLALHKLTYKQLSELSGVPSSSIHAYAQGRVNNPDDDNLRRIAQAFGNPPEIIQQMRREAMSATAAENKLIAESDDKQRMEQLSALLRSNMLAVMEEYRTASAAQQTEIIQHADRRIEEERARFKERTAEVVKQCNEEIEKAKASCEERIQTNERHCEQRIADVREHMHALIEERSRHESKLEERNISSREYLKTSVANALAACLLLGLTNIFFGAYAIYAYATFDMHDLTRGLHQGTHSVGPMILFLSAALIAVAVWRVVVMVMQKPQRRA